MTCGTSSQIPTQYFQNKLNPGGFGGSAYLACGKSAVSLIKFNLVFSMNHYISNDKMISTIF